MTVGPVRSARAAARRAACLIVAAAACFAGSTTTTSAHGGEAPNLLDALLAHPRLARYFHTDRYPERLPIQVVNASGVELAPPDPAHARVASALVSPADKPQAGRAVLIIDRATVDGGRAELDFRFPVEGLAGKVNASHAAARGWAVDTIMLVER